MTCPHKPLNDVSDLVSMPLIGERIMNRELSRLVLSVTSYCNLRCKYCYVFDSEKEYLTSQTMPPEIIQEAIHYIFNYYDTVRFIQFFGGEPNLALQSMLVVVDETRKICDVRGLPCPRFGIITNLTILNEEILSFYQHNRLKVTVSIDGIETIHNFLRKYSSGRSTHDKVVCNINQLTKAGVHFSVECTFTRAHIDKGITVVDLLKYFDQIGAARADIVCVMTKCNSELDVYNEAFQQVIQLFTEAVDYWFDYWRQGGKTMFGIIGEIISALRDSSCKRIYCPAGESYLAIAPNGEIFPCHLFIGNKKYALGSVKSPSNILGFKNSLGSRSCCNNCSVSSLCFSCLGRNEYYCGNWEQPFEYDCILKRAVINKVLENLDSEISLENRATSPNNRLKD